MPQLAKFFSEQKMEILSKMRTWFICHANMTFIFGYYGNKACGKGLFLLRWVNKEDFAKKE
jgi:hypothetical protein